MSWLFKTVDPNAPTFHPVTERYQDSELAGELEPRDLEWLLAGGFAAETQTYYNFLEDGTFLMVQFVHSSIGIGIIRPTVQLTFKMYNPNTKEVIWRSNNVSNFVTPPPGLDKRSCKSDGFSVTYNSNPGTDTPESYTIVCNACDDVQATLTIARPASAPGWKIGKGAKAGHSFYGTDIEKPDAAVFHSFWPRTWISGQIIYKGKAIPAEGPGMYVHALMGMRPDRIAKRWNFCNFQSKEHGGVSAIQMELTTRPEFGRKVDGKDAENGVTVNFGSIVLGGKLVSVTAETIWPDGSASSHKSYLSRALHLDTVHDKDTSYAQPSKLRFEWSAPSLEAGFPGTISAEVEASVGTPKEPEGLVEKVDVLAEIPAMVKSVISYVAGTKPYIYQWYKPATLKVTAPDAILPGASAGLNVEGHLYTEASFIS
ncbi:survival factor 1 [Schizopora paradoxa]|uniref:Survival factor 1 n=1 Tax=Schizopora paradoxa TaxID=27342 RepID=A0A0H2SJD3_9AGAM|nr:survival factor 1 [Schizopora paradoxa]